MIYISELFDNFLIQNDIVSIKESNSFLESITHKSFSKKHSNERLEFLGDAILSFVVGDLLYREFPSSSEGDLSKKKSFLVSRDLALVIAKKIGLHEILRVKNVDLVDPSHTSVVACAFEALIASIYLECGIHKVRSIARDLFSPYLSVDFDPKTRLQEICQKRFNTLPEYKLISVGGDDHAPIFTMSLEINNISVSIQDRQKKLAEKKLASMMLEKLCIKI